MENKKTFKDFVNDDLDVFFNLDEFADEHELDGEIVPLIIIERNNEEMSEVPRDQLYSSQEVFKEQKIIYVKTKDYYVPKVDSKITLDNEDYYVDEATETNGVIRIVVSMNES